MLDQFFEVAYTESAVKTASAAVKEKMQGMSTETLQKLASGEKVAWSDVKACGPGDSGGPVSWLDQFKNTPLFDKALQLERADLQLEQEDIRQRQAQVGQETWVKRDALRLQRRLLELDLVLEGEAEGPAAGAEQTEEKGVELLEQAQAEERAAGEGEEPHEQKEDAAIQQFQQAQSEEAAAKAQEQSKDPKEPKKTPLASVDVKEASLAKLAHAEATGRLLAKLAAGDPEGHMVRRALLSTPISAAIEAKPGHKTESFGKTLGHGVVEQLKGMGKGIAGGGALGAAAGAIHGGLTGGKERAISQGLKGLGMGAAGGAYAGSVAGGLKGAFGAEASRLHGEHSKHNKEAADTTETSKVRAAVAKKFPNLESKEASVQELRAFVKAANTALLVPGLMGAAAGAEKGGKHDASAGFAIGGALGAMLGSDAGRFVGRALGSLGGMPPQARAALELAGYGLGGVAGYRHLTGRIDSAFTEQKEELERKAKRLAGRESKKTAGLIGSALTAGKAMLPQVAGAAKGIGSLASTAYNAGGVGQVAKSLGSVATGFAKANPLAAAGVAAAGAGAAGLAAGRLSKSNQPQLVRA